MKLLFFRNGYCQCPQGRTRGPCKHKQAVSKYHGTAEFSILPFHDPCVRAAYHYIATGETQSSSWYRDLDTPSSNPNVDGFIQEHREQQNSDSVSLEEARTSDDTDNNDVVMDSLAETSAEEGENIEALKEEFKENYHLFGTKLFSCLQKHDFIKCVKKFSATLK